MVTNNIGDATLIDETKMPGTGDGGRPCTRNSIKSWTILSCNDTWFEPTW